MNNRIAELRKAHGLTQEKLAKELGIAQNTLSQYENYVRQPSARIVNKIAEFFNVSTVEVLGIPEPFENYAARLMGEELPLPDVERRAGMVTSDFSMAYSDYTRVVCLDDINEVNVYLDAGWRIIRVSDWAIANGNTTPCPIFTLGWRGDPRKATYPAFSSAGDEYINEL